VVAARCPTANCSWKANDKGDSGRINGRSIHCRSPYQKKGRPAKFIITQPYSEREKLILLVEAIEAASVGLSRGLLNAYEVIGEHLHSLDALGFAPDTEESELRYVKRDFLNKKEAVLRLDKLLHELKEAI